MAKFDSRITLNVEGLPKALAALRREEAKMLRSWAEAEADPRVAQRLRELAAKCEAGVTE